MKDSFLKRNSSVLLVLLLAVSLVFAAAVMGAPAAVEDQGVTDGLQVDDGIAADAEYSHRVIVELEAPSVASRFAADASVRAPSGRLDLRSPAVASYQAQLEAQQADFIGRMSTALPAAEVASYINERGQTVEATYQLLLNAVAVEPGVDVKVARKELAQMDGVKAVYLDYAHEPNMYASLPLINAQAVWDLSGGRADAGSGVKVASMDGGVHHDAPMFDGTGWTYPPGYPLGDTANTNGKIIVSRAYFRDWDPPAPGDENTWPGENGTPHGTHTASTAVGNIVNGFEYVGKNITETLSGVAPGAWVMSYRMFYASVTGDGSFYTIEGVAALEDIVADGADVLNNSWGGGPGGIGGEFDPLDNALIAASQAGVFVSMSNGNAGPGTGTGDHPSADYMNVAASTTSGTYSAGRIRVSAPEPVPAELEGMPFGTAGFGGQLALGNVYSFTFKTAASVDPANVDGCDPWTGTPFTGTAAVISRGSCNFSQKVYYAEQAEAELVIIYNNQGDGILNMSCGNFCDPGEITIPSFFIGQTNGEGMVDWYATNGDDSEVTVDYVAFSLGNEPDVIANFSSRGPGVGNVLKPDIAAPGVNIMAQGYTPGATGEARHLGFGQVSGTSMASPHVAGSAAVLREIYPGWSNAQIKSALMSTAKYMDIYNADGSPAQPLDMGAGRLDLTNAADPGVILDPPSLSFGQMVTGTMDHIVVEATSVAAATETYDLSTLYTGAGFAMTQTTTLPGFELSTTSVTLDPGETETFTVTFNTSEGMGLGDNQGYIIMDGDNGHHAHMPAWARVAAAPNGKVLLIDNDFSFLLGLPDYAGYYADALDELGIPYDYYNADTFFNMAASLPEAGVMAAYDAVIYFSGDNFYPDGSFTVATPLTALDMDRLNEYANTGGVIIAMGQDATSVMDESFFQLGTLGAEQLQDSITGFTLPELPVVPSEQAPEAFQEIALDLSGADTFIGMATLPDEMEAPVSAFLPVTVGGSGLPQLPAAPTGMAAFDYNLDSNRLDYDVTLTATVPFTLTAAHIHEGEFFQSGPVLYPLFSGPAYVTDTINFAGSVVIDEADEATLLSDGLYLNTHTTARPASAVRTQIRLNPASDGADNQYFIDELDPTPNVEPNPIPGTTYPYSPLLAYPGDNQMEDGIVAIAHRGQPNLEYPGLNYLGRSIFTSFGLEGINNGPNTTSRADLLWHLLAWGWDEPEVTIDDITDTYTDTTSLTVLEANVTSNITGTTGVSYRWDFGDGSEFTVPYDSNVVSYTYDDTYCNTDVTVRVEAVDSWGNRAIGSETITVTNCGSGD